jgi:uncharacterized membrane protein
MSILIAGLAVFFVVHSVAIFNEPWRHSRDAELGEWPWKGVYSMAAHMLFHDVVYVDGAGRPPGSNGTKHRQTAN